MPFLVCVVPVCPMRLAASHRTEQVSQLLFGEVAEIIEVSGDFVLLKNLYDSYEGWCQRNQLAEIGIEQFEGGEERLSAKLINELSFNGQPMFIPLGCPVAKLLNQSFKVENYTIVYKQEALAPVGHKGDKDYLRQMAMLYLNTAYQWGGRSVFGIDCSGFTQAVFRCVNVPLLRDAYQQARQGDAIGFLEEVACGDLAFFDNAEGKITHVGMLLDKQNIIHASGKVRIDTIDHQGIVNIETGVRTHKLRLLKRVL